MALSHPFKEGRLVLPLSTPSPFQGRSSSASSFHAFQRLYVKNGNGWGLGVHVHFEVAFSGQDFLFYKYFNYCDH